MILIVYVLNLIGRNLQKDTANCCKKETAKKDTANCDNEKVSFSSYKFWVHVSKKKKKKFWVLLVHVFLVGMRLVFDYVTVESYIFILTEKSFNLIVNEWR